MAALNFRHRRIRRRWLLGGSVVLTAVACLFLIASASGNLTGSSFESGDGNMKVNTSGNKDWQNVSFFYVNDLESTGSDDAYLSGQKQDTACPVIDLHGSPPKDDFTDVATYSEVIGTKTYLYGATLRYQSNGNAAENVELNKGTNGFCQDANGDDTELVARVAGDKLIAIDYVSGGPQFHVLTWVTSGACNVSSHTAPCWGATVQTIGAAGAEGAINPAQIPSGENYIGPAGAVGKEKFAEFGINLTDAGIIPAGECETFTQSTFGSRSSGSSFVSTTKDITVVNHPISNCGLINIHKEDDAGNPLEGVAFNIYKDLGPNFGPPDGAGSNQDAYDDTEDSTTSAGTCTTNADGDCTIVDVTIAKYWIVEDPNTVPDGYNAAPDQWANITTAGQEVNLTFVDPRQPGTVTIHKVDDTPADDGGPNPLGGVTFNLYEDLGPSFGPPDGNGSNQDAYDPLEDSTTSAASCTTKTAANATLDEPIGSCTISSVANGLYWVVEDSTTVPSGYTAAADQYADVNAGGSSVDLTFTNPRTHRVIVIVCHEGSNTLDSSDVTLPDGSTDTGDTKASVSAVPSGADWADVTESDLCSIGGAQFGGLGHGDVKANVDVAHNH
jgi:hypothetical protein